jgi:hypothetical protein
MLPAIAVTMLASLACAKEQEPFPFPPNIQQAIAQVGATDANLHATVTAYHRQQNDPRIEAKLKQLLSARSRMVTKLSRPIESSIKRLTAENAKARKEVDKLYKIQSSLDQDRNARKYEAVTSRFNEAALRVTDTRVSLKAHAALLEQLQLYEPPKKIGMPEGVVKSLPVFADGPAKGYFAHYVGRSYEALVDKHGVLTVHIRHPNSTNLYEHAFVFCAPKMKYRKPKSSYLSTRKLMGLVPPADAALQQPRKLDLRGFCEGYAQFRLQIQFMPQSVIVSGAYRDPIDLADPSELQLETKFPKIQKALPKKGEEKGSFRDYKVAAKLRRKGKPQRDTMNYYGKLPSEAQIKQAKIEGPWGSNVIALSVKGKTLPKTSKSSRKSLYEGHTLYYSCAGHNFSRPENSMILTVTPGRR